MRLFLTAFLATALLPAMGCNLYFSGGDDPPCDEWGGGDRAAPQIPEEILLLRNPESGVCEDFGWTGPNPPIPCNDACGPCVGSTEPGTTNPVPDSGEGPQDDEGDSPSLEEQQDPAPQPSWGQCESACTGLQEDSCLASDNCRGIYAPEANGTPGLFLDCWATDQNPSGIVDCEGLDAYSCSTSDACVAVHEFACGGSGGGKPTPDGFQEPECVPGFFLSCHNETPQSEGCYSDQDCNQGESCNAGEICLSDGTGDAVCYGYCVPDVCPPIDIDCPEGFMKICPQDGCEADCVCEPIDPVDPGECDGDVFCDSLPPLCEAGSTPGIANGCWTGECIDLSLCPAATCEDIAGESMCIARDDCSPFYVGDNCSCDPNGCSCAEWVFDSCGIDAP